MCIERHGHRKVDVNIDEAKYVMGERNHQMVSESEGRKIDAQWLSGDDAYQKPTSTITGGRDYFFFLSGI